MLVKRVGVDSGGHRVLQGPGTGTPSNILHRYPPPEAETRIKRDLGTQHGSPMNAHHQKQLKRMGTWTLVLPTFCFRKMAEEDKSSRYVWLLRLLLVSLLLLK